MLICPTPEEFKKLSDQSPYVPVVGVIQAPQAALDRIYQELYAREAVSFLFESGKGPEEISRFSFLGSCSGRQVTIKNKRASLQYPGQNAPQEIEIDEAMRLLNFNDAAKTPEYAPHFWGGWIGFAGYEAGGIFETLPDDKGSADDLSDLFFAETFQFLRFDHKTKELKIIVAVESGNPDQSYESAVSELNRIENRIRALPSSCDLPAEDASLSTEEAPKEFLSNMTQTQYMECVRRAKNYIEEGDVYQVNLAQRFETETEQDPISLYRRLWKVNPSPFSGIFNFPEATLISSSPERLVKLEGDWIETRPIAGTRPRGKTEQEDHSLSAELLLNEKEKAEHLMLVDLERNDLGRLCLPGQVSVTDLMFLEQYSHVTHIVSNIRGKLKPGTSLKEILTAVFPGGTITGCPKIRCMEIINELEPCARGPYSGSFGYIGFSRHMDLNIIIRSVLIQDKRASFHVGAGIVADSDPETEYAETLSKAGAMMEALSTLAKETS
ncbi:MAG: anthranilate synthase component I family protein [Candidatus Nitrohelix vancouverensis]|uniref:Anthranilate synthase component 1 n=1 Tax=Candidatus Nitrohelix vancouverensis TaxID=2705534 RepID=A0A7T0C3K1_9BACT|nr:MAG: anthranilate synthase component I family protein [Candidatus Nitrohelix vancouverensis]